ncbi:MAG: pilus assembly PilX N-terminal domain-containing protein, partial [Elusimicrobiota bacterium]
MKNKYGNKGAVLFMVVLFSVIASIAGLSYIYLTETERITSQQDINKDRAFYLADAGLERAKTYLMTSLDPRIFETDNFNPFGGSVILENNPETARGRYDVTIDPFDTNNEPGTLDKGFIVYSTGSIVDESGVSDVVIYEKTIIAEVLLENLCKYVYASDKELEGGAQGANRQDRIYFVGCDEFDGRVHSNDEISMCYTFGPPGFSERYSNDEYDDDSLKDVQTAKDFYRFMDRRNRRQGGVVRNDFPVSDYPAVERRDFYRNFNMKRLENAAENGMGVIDDDCEIEIKNQSIDVDRSNITIPTPDEDENAVLFVNGDVEIYSLRNPEQAADGLMEWITIASSGTITITGDIKYHDKNPGMLGLVALEEIIVDPPDNFWNRPDVFSIDAAMMTYESFFNRDYEIEESEILIDDFGLEIDGCIIQRVRKEVGRAYI